MGLFVYGWGAPISEYDVYEAAEMFPVATPTWERLVSLPLFPGMRTEEQDYTVQVVRDLCTRNRA